MLSNYEREVAVTIVEALVEYGMNDHLAQYGAHSTNHWFAENELYEEGFCVSGGASKLCIMHEDLDNWVIKVSYNVHVKHDHATMEYEVYCAAEEAGFAEYFPETVYLGTFGGCAYYAQAMAECCEEEITSEWYSALTTRYEDSGDEYDSDCIWSEVDDLDDWERALLLFGDESLCSFLNEHRVGDLHEGNFGYIGGRLVIVDFSGWHC